MEPSFFLIATAIVASAIGAMTLRKLVHCALCLAVAFAGLAALFLNLDAQFAGFAQVLVYVGAVAVLIVFALLLTRGHESEETSRFATSWKAGTAIAVAVALALIVSIVGQSDLLTHDISPPEVTVRMIGEKLMTDYVVPLEVAGVLLTVALIGGIVLARTDPED